MPAVVGFTPSFCLLVLTHVAFLDQPELTLVEAKMRGGKGDKNKNNGGKDDKNKNNGGKDDKNKKPPIFINNNYGHNGFKKNNLVNNPRRGGNKGGQKGGAGGRNNKPSGGGDGRTGNTELARPPATTTTTTSAGPQPCFSDPAKAREQLEESLSAIIGLNEVKRDVRKRIAVATVNSYAKRYANPSASPGKVRQGFAFLGPPGTGKTTVAQMLGSAFCLLGMVKHDGFLEVRPDDLIGQYLGQSGFKTRKKLEPALGGVIFVDEAYMLTSQDGRGPSQYQQEVVGALMDLMDRRASDTVFVFAGYTCEMEDMFKVNEGLKRRIPDIFRFMALTVQDLVQVLRRKVEVSGCVIMPDYNDEGMALLAREFDSSTSQADEGFWSLVGGRPKELGDPSVPTDKRDMPKRFSTFLRLKVGQLHTPGEETFSAQLPAIQQNLEISANVRSLEDKYDAFIAAEIAPLLEQLPAEQREKSNGGVIDQLLDRMYHTRNARMMADESVSSGGCKATKGINGPLFRKFCPVFLVYTVGDLEDAVKQATESWGTEEGGDEDEEG